MKVINFYYNFFHSFLYEKNIETESLQTIVSFTKISLGPLQMVACDPKNLFKQKSEIIWKLQ